MSQDICISFDTTGSMYPCLTQVRRQVESLTSFLFKKIPDLRMSIIAHGDYCDPVRIRMQVLDFTSDKGKVNTFIRGAKKTRGGDFPEMYEQVLADVKELSWRNDANKACVLIGDAYPHPVGYRCRDSINRIDWEIAAKKLVGEKINIYPVQCLRQRCSDFFYQGLGKISCTPVLPLTQFADIYDYLLAISLKQIGDEAIEEHRGLFSRKHSVQEILDILVGITATTPRTVQSGLSPVPSHRFQVLPVDRDCSIKEFVEEHGLEFKKGRGFYQFTKRVLIQDYKEVIVQDEDGYLFTGKEARKLMNIPKSTSKVSPTKGGAKGFIQSTSVNRKLLKGTHFLYEVEDYEYA